MKKITKREMYESIKGLAESGVLRMQDFNENIDNAAVIEFCMNEIELLDKRAQKSQEAAKKKSADGDELSNAIYEIMSNEEFEPISDITSRIEDPDVTVAKVIYRLNVLVKTGKAEKKEIEIPGSEGQKKRRAQGYKRIV